MKDKLSKEMEINKQIEEDEKFYKDLKQAYQENAEHDAYLAELFHDASAEADAIMLNDEQRNVYLALYNKYSKYLKSF